MNYIYGNTLVLGDSSYLEHHGIKNQKWGIRRFQNPDGSLTAAGRIRYGVTGAAKAAFKVGKKLGSATASAAKAGVKKAKENAYAKKKEKASQTREGVIKNKKMFTNEELERLEKRFKIEDDMRNAGLRHGQEIAKTISAYSDAAVKTMNALQTGGKAVKAISDGLSALQDYKEKRDTKAKTSEKTSNKPPNDDNPPNDGGGGLGAKKAAATNGPKEQTKYDYGRRQVQDELNAKRKADLDRQEEYIKAYKDALVKVSKQRQSEQDARDEDLNRRDKAASEREAKLKETAKTAADVMSKLKKRQADLDKKESFLNSIESYRLDTLSEFKKNEEEAARRKKKNARHSAIGEEMYTDHLEHHGIKGQRWGVRRFQNADGSLTDKGRKHYQKKLALEERKLTAANASRGQYERVRTPMSVGMGILGAVAGAMVGVPAGPAGIAAGAAVVSSIAASSNYAAYTVAGIVAGQGAKRNMKKIAKYKEALAQDAFEIQNGVLIYGSGQSGELKHFGLKGMKWGVRRFQNKDGSLTEAGKQRYANTGNLDSGGGGGGGAPEEEDEETKKAIEEAAKKEGMTVDEYRKKFADKVAALKEKARDVAKEVADTVYNEAGGKYKKAAAENNAAANRALREAAAKDMKAKESYHDYERLNERGAEMAASWAKSSAESYKKSADNSRYAHRMYKKNQAEANKRYKESLAGRVEATSRKIGAKAQEAKDKLKSRAPKRSIALEVTNTGPAPVGQTEIHTADLYNKYFGAVARARKTSTRR